MEELTAILASTARIDIAAYLGVLIWIYFGLLFIRILLSWLPRLPDNNTVRGVVQFIHELTEPYLKIFRRIIPPVSTGGAAIDLSPMIAMIVLALLGRLLVRVIAG